MMDRGRTTCGVAALVLAFLVIFVSPAFAADPQLDTSNPVAFFTNLASRLLKAEMNLNLHRLQIHPTNQYTPAVHRLLQVTANIYDAINPTNDAFGPLPTVFRPRFKTEGDAVFIEGYEEVVSFDPAELSPQPLDLSFSNTAALVKSNSLIFGVPFVIGARKVLVNGTNVFVHANGTFNRLDDILGVTELTTSSPYLNLGVTDAFTGHNAQLERGLSDEAYEAIPIRLLSRLRPDSLGSIIREAGGWRIQFTGFDGFPYAVEESTNLLNWQSVSTNEPAEGFFQIVLPVGTENRFYRSRLLP